MNNITRKNNGRVDLKYPDTNQLFKLYDKMPAHQCVGFRERAIAQMENTMLSKAFFSDENIQILQNGIRAGVYRKSNNQYVIGPQDCDSLKVIMRSIYLQHSKNNDTSIVQQIEELNKIVLDYAIFNVYSEAQGYMKYLSDVSSLPIPMAHPVQTSQKDKNSVLMPNWF